jgi:hypothetical protein
LFHHDPTTNNFWTFSNKGIIAELNQGTISNFASNDEESQGLKEFKDD